MDRMKIMLIAVIVIFPILFSQYCEAAYIAHCNNPDLGGGSVCVQTAKEAGKACSIQYGNRARAVSVKPSKCSPS